MLASQLFFVSSKFTLIDVMSFVFCTGKIFAELYKVTLSNI